MVNLKVSRTRVFLFPLSACIEARTLSPDATLPPVVTPRRSLLHHADVSSSVFEVWKPITDLNAFSFLRNCRQREESGAAGETFSVSEDQPPKWTDVVMMLNLL